MYFYTEVYEEGNFKSDDDGNFFPDWKHKPEVVNCDDFFNINMDVDFKGCNYSSPQK